MEMAEAMERVTAYLWVAVSLLGLVLRIRRLWILSKLSYDDPRDRDYLATVVGSSILRLVVKCLLLFGGVLAVWLDPSVPAEGQGVLFWIWRVGAISIPVLLLIEDVRVDRMRRRLGFLGSIRRGGAA